MACAACYSIEKLNNINKHIMKSAVPMVASLLMYRPFCSFLFSEMLQITSTNIINGLKFMLFVVVGS